VATVTSTQRRERSMMWRWYELIAMENIRQALRRIGRCLWDAHRWARTARLLEGLSWSDDGTFVLGTLVAALVGGLTEGLFRTGSGCSRRGGRNRELVRVEGLDWCVSSELSQMFMTGGHPMGRGPASHRMAFGLILPSLATQRFRRGRWGRRDLPGASSLPSGSIPVII